MEQDLKVQPLPVSEIFADPDFNCRGEITRFSVIELMRSIEANGLQQPIVVQPCDRGQYKYRVVMGHRRFSAFQIMGRATIPAVVRADLSDLQARTLNLIENLERKQLTIMQEARAIQKFLVAGVTQDEVARLINQSRGWVQTRFTALKLPAEIQAEIDAGFITTTQIRQIYGLPSKELQFEAVREIKDSKLRGEKRAIVVKPAKRRTGNERKLRNVSEVFEMQSRIQELVGNNIGTRCLAWAAGEISDRELWEDIVKLATESGISYEQAQSVLLGA